jgi:hypothetical protein
MGGLQNAALKQRRGAGLFYPLKIKRTFYDRSSPNGGATNFNAPDFGSVKQIRALTFSATLNKLLP